MKLIDNYIYFYHLDKYAVLPFYPDQISDQHSISYVPTNALGRSAPVFSYSQSGPRTISFSFKLHRDMMDDFEFSGLEVKDNVLDFTQKDYVDTLISHLQACAVPKYNVYTHGSKGIEPPMVAVRFGSDVFIKGVVNSAVSTTFSGPILGYDDGRRRYAEVSVGFTVYETDPYDAITVAKLGSYRGLVSTFKNGIYKSNDNILGEPIVYFGETKQVVGSYNGGDTASRGGSTTHTSSSGRVHGGGGRRLGSDDGGARLQIHSGSGKRLDTVVYSNYDPLFFSDQNKTFVRTFDDDGNPKIVHVVSDPINGIHIKSSLGTPKNLSGGTGLAGTPAANPKQGYTLDANGYFVRMGN